MLQPKRVKYRKTHRGRMLGSAHSGTAVTFGEYGLRAEENAWITARQLEAARRVMVRFLRHGGKMWIRVFPDKVVTKKPAETRQGGGKGAPDHWVAVVRRGRMMFEIAGISEENAKRAIKLASYKLPIQTGFVAREGSSVEG